MIKKVLVKKDNVIAYSCDFQTIEEAQAWIALNQASNSWGKDERWIMIDSLEMMNENIDFATEVESRDDDLGNPHLWYKFEADYVIEIEDAPDLEESTEALRYLKATDWYIIREMDSGEPCPQEIKDARALARTKVVN